MTSDASAAPVIIRMHERDNVAIVANDGGLPAGTALAGGPVLLDRVPQGHKVALVDIAADAPVLRYGYDDAGRIVTEYIRRLRGHLARHGLSGCLVTRHGFGYSYNPDAPVILQ